MRTISLLWTSPAGGKAVVEQGEVSPAYGNRRPASVARVRVRAPLPVEIATLIVSQRGVEERWTFGQVHGEKALRAYRFEGRGSTGQLFLSDSGRWQTGAWASDAALLYCRIAEGRIAHLVMVNGSFVTYQGRALLQHKKKMERFEWQRRGDAAVNGPSATEPVSHSLDLEAELDSVS